MAERRPNFLIIGAPKSGTTALYEALRKHPQIFLPGLKEPHFFCDGMGVEDWSQYLGLFDQAGSARLLGESSTNYLYDPAAAGRIHEALGAIRIVILLRHPVDQMYSMFHHNRRNHLETLDFEEALAAEQGRVAEGDNPMLFYRGRASFADQVERYFTIFGRDNVFVGFYDELEADGETLVGDVLAFLGVGGDVTPGLRRANPHGQARSSWLSRFLARPKPFPRLMPMIDPNLKNRIKRKLRELNTRATSYGAMDEGLRSRLCAEFRRDIERLLELTGSETPRSWLEGADV